MLSEWMELVVINRRSRCQPVDTELPQFHRRSPKTEMEMEVRR